ncbi:GNAT family N-acetyltransferase [Pseudogracilibacillus auburnensis]|uniref:GNAT family N-acetyltransferase n=1 Tax=Pseudogracilibacillus auburnensis TaxID=1494959 RepID=UPI001A96751E|nr:GNAT family N-acetyltransferase [Pseudogracilibacillus auburnensis]MBO1006026.1 GNAT family N-acetyltransferase [Pseudogracilibacillus auburnensis]
MKIVQLDVNRSDDLIDLWNGEFSGEFPMRQELFLQNSFEDRNLFLPGSLMATDDDGRLIGYVICKRWQEETAFMSAHTGWIQVLLVDQAYRNKGVGSLLLDRAEKALKDSGVTDISLGADPFHYFPGIPTERKDAAAWFEGKGYEPGRLEYDLLAEYRDTDVVNEWLPVPEIEIALLQIDEKEEMLQFMHRVFPGRWEYETIHYFNRGGTGREFVVLKKAGKIIGYCRINDEHSPVIFSNTYWAPLFKETLGGIGSLGVDPDERGKGYGLLALQAGIATLRKRGINNIAIDWTGIVDFYGKMGYMIWKEYQRYNKAL